MKFGTIERRLYYIDGISEALDCGIGGKAYDMAL